MNEPADTVDVPEGAVVVGVDGSAHSSHALQWAADEARRREVPLVVVRAWSITNAPRPSDCPPGYVPSLLEYEEAVRAEVEHQVEETVGDRSKLAVSVCPVHNRPAPALVASSAKACTIVVGSRGRGGFRGLLLGSVSEQVVRHSHCPVTVVRHNAGQA
jgi:nucleotide-binding universal stress UspA family protein